MSTIHFGSDEDGEYFEFTMTTKLDGFEIFIDGFFICAIGLNKTGQWIQKKGNKLPKELMGLIRESIEAAAVKPFS